MILAYKPGTAASRLAKELRARIYYPRQKKQLTAGRKNYETSINWGLRKSYLGSLPHRMLNENAEVAVSKQTTFTKLQEAKLPVPRWSKNYDELVKLIGPGRGILGRADGLSSGVGIELIDSSASTAIVGKHDFYVERLSYHREFRVHVFADSVIHVQAKQQPPGSQLLVKNYENGCTYTAEHLERFVTETTLAQLKELGKAAVASLALDFGAVDIFQNKKGKLYVLEINTAPGLRSDAAYTAYRAAVKKVWRL